MKKIFLTPQQRHRLNVWLIDRQNGIKDYLPGAVATEATRSLGFTVTTGQLTTSLTATGVKIAGREATKDKQDKKINTVAMAVVALYDRFGESLPVEFMEEFL